MAQITEKNTKTQILEAYNKAMSELKELKTTTIADEQEAKRMANVVKNAEEIVSLGILNPEIESKYSDLKLAIENAKEELDTLFNIKAEAFSLEGIINAKNTKAKELDEAIKVQEELHRQNMKEQEADLKAAIQSARETYKEEIANINKLREREAEEFEYSLKRERQIENDKWEDEKAQREAELAKREKAVIAREDVLADKEDEFTSLQRQVANIPNLIEEAYERGKEDGKAKLEKSYAIEKAHLKKEHEWSIKSLEDKNSTLELQLDHVTTAKAILEEKLDKAYAEMRTLATTTVQSSAVKVIETKVN